MRLLTDIPSTAEVQCAVTPNCHNEYVEKAVSSWPLYAVAAQPYKTVDGGAALTSLPDGNEWHVTRAEAPAAATGVPAEFAARWVNVSVRVCGV